jgi:very-short-patch-repair endonuclease
MTDAERKLWSALRGRQLLGRKFRRQHPAKGFYLDFVSLEDKLIVEVDGSQHLDSAHDARRGAVLMRRGFRILRFWNHDVLKELLEVVDVIERALLEGPPP